MAGVLADYLRFKLRLLLLDKTMENDSFVSVRRFALKISSSKNSTCKLTFYYF